jgi:hypothetical protein
MISDGGCDCRLRAASGRHCDTLIVSTLKLGTGRTTILQGAVHLVIFAVYFTTVVP